MCPRSQSTVMCPRSQSTVMCPRSQSTVMCQRSQSTVMCQRSQSIVMYQRSQSTVMYGHDSDMCDRLLGKRQTLMAPLNSSWCQVGIHLVLFSSTIGHPIADEIVYCIWCKHSWQAKTATSVSCLMNQDDLKYNVLLFFPRHQWLWLMNMMT